MEIKIGKYPFTYLGVPISYKLLTAKDQTFLTSKTAARLSSWKAKCLTKHQIINTIPDLSKTKTKKKRITSSQIMHYHLYTFQMVSLKQRNNPENFFWSTDRTRSGAHLVNWGIIQSHKLYGGLGIRNLQNIRESLLAKRVQMVLNGEKDLWVQSVTQKYEMPQHWPSTNLSNQMAWSWKLMLKALYSNRLV